MRLLKSVSMLVFFAAILVACGKDNTVAARTAPPVAAPAQNPAVTPTTPVNPSATNPAVTPDFLLMSSGKERLPKEMHFPLIVKPVAEGSSKGVFGKSVVDNETELRELAREIAARYRQPALVENYIPGREFTVGMLGERRPKVLPIMEVVFTGNDPTPVYDFSAKLDWTHRVRYDAPAKLEPGQQREIERVARGVFSALGCRDVARVDFRMDEGGHVYFLECNPLPGLTPGWSDLVMIANAGGLDYKGLIGEILSSAIRRYQERERERRREERSASSASSNPAVAANVASVATAVSGPATTPTATSTTTRSPGAPASGS